MSYLGYSSDDSDDNDDIQESKWKKERNQEVILGVKFSDNTERRMDSLNENLNKMKKVFMREIFLGTDVPKILKSFEKTIDLTFQKLFKKYNQFFEKVGKFLLRNLHRINKIVKKYRIISSLSMNKEFGSRFPNKEPILEIIVGKEESEVKKLREEIRNMSEIYRNFESIKENEVSDYKEEIISLREEKENLHSELKKTRIKMHQNVKSLKEQLSSEQEKTKIILQKMNLTKQQQQQKEDIFSEKKEIILSSNTENLDFQDNEIFEQEKQDQSVVGLLELLKMNSLDEYFDKFKDEEINDIETFLDLDRKDLAEMKFRIGIRKKILKVINSLKSK